jgi:hypothetical protein
LAETRAKRSPQLEQLLDRARPRHEPEVLEAREAFAECRPAIAAPMLDIVFKSGRIRSFNYAYLRELDFEPGDRLTMRFADGREVVTEGRDLERLRQQVRLHRASEIRECTESEGMLKVAGESHIERISIKGGEQNDAADN